MSLVFRALPNLDRIDIAYSASLGTPSAFTWWGWVYLTDDTGPNFIAIRANAASTIQGAYVRLATGINFFVDRSGSGAELQTNTSQYTLDAWNFMAFTYDEGGATAADTINSYSGTLSATVTETAYSAQLQGNGGTQNNDGPYIVGNRTGYSRPLDGQIAYWGIINRYLSLGEIQSLQWKPRVVDNTVVYMVPGYTGAASITDWSGNANTGVGNGLVVSDHVPIGPAWQGNQAYFGAPGVSGHPSVSDHVPLSAPYAISNPQPLAPAGGSNAGTWFIRGSRQA